MHGVHVVGWCSAVGCGAMRWTHVCSRHEGSCRRVCTRWWGAKRCCTSVVVQCWAQARPAHPLCLTAAASVSMHAHPTRPCCGASRTPQGHSVWCVHWTPHARDVLASWGGRYCASSATLPPAAAAHNTLRTSSSTFSTFSSVSSIKSVSAEATCTPAQARSSACQHTHLVW